MQRFTVAVLFAALFIAAAGGSTCAGVTTHSASAPGARKVVSYFTNWAQYRSGNCKFDVSDIDGSLFTHINYAFAKLSSSFEVQAIEWNDNTDGGLYDQLNSLKKQHPHLKVMISFGGWSFNESPATRDIFSNMASSATNRATFIQNAMQWARKYSFDGVDIDWEYPGYAPQGGRSSDTPNFTSLLKEFRAAIEAEDIPSGKERLLLTIAAPVGKAQLAGYELNKIHQHLDWINLMAYDIHGSWEATTDFHTAVHADNENNIDWAIKYYKTNGVPSSKIVMGLATYGKSWTLTSASDHGVGAKASGSGTAGPCTGQAGFLSYYEIKNLVDSGATEVYDEKVKATYAYKDNQWVSYDNKDSIRAKMEYVKDKDLGGSMIWAMDLDADAGIFNELQCVIAQCMFNLAGISSSDTNEASNNHIDYNPHTNPNPPPSEPTANPTNPDSESTSAKTTTQTTTIESKLSPLTQTGTTARDSAELFSTAAQFAMTSWTIIITVSVLFVI